MIPIRILSGMIFIGLLSACSKGDPIYGSWTGKSSGNNSYTILGDEPPEKIKRRQNLPSKYSRDVNLSLTGDNCEIVFDSNFDDPVDCVYMPEEKVIVIPLWRNGDSIYDSGLMITKLDEEELELVNKFTRIFTDNFEYKHEMEGSEFYFLTKNQ